ncbi:BppU family phage baseplate upper protein [Pediococcus acidilactici]|uniref:BppU family phage baseplate upper protein n=1 Tax=Pediococcus acidilactici TaxID=1254 RepID=UPI002935EC62|nr:BppU family phage baseplate upper protein [Pediococcus acidilactici]MDV2602173.1 BppU family phage baseplate upper protein [Pediococcus acidilactici]MDV2843598.1 BppU family phage baseplate upper protein [Pediococcus acidilactici]WQS22789.1 BppU family phage baseplate upper protein [Pediococcus acidilactici]WQS26310.1 BppU family phage baseplate upper protein [Pediococcus acidilactici]
MQKLKYIIGGNKRALVKDVQNFKIDFNTADVHNFVQARQYENTMRQVFVDLVNEGDGSPYDLTGANIMFEGTLPDNTHKIMDAKHGVILDPQNGQFRFDFPKQAFAVAGSYTQAFFRIMRDGDSVTTLEFDLEVLADKVISGLVPADYITPFEDLYDELEAIVASGNKKVDEAIAAWNAKFQAKFNEIAALSQDVANHLIEMRAQLDVIQDKIKSSDIATASQLKEELNKVRTDLMTEIGKRPTNQMVIDMLERGFANFDGGQPHAIDDEATLKKTYPSGHDGVFITINTGHMWMWGPQGAWIDGGPYQSTVIKDQSVDITKLAGNAQAPIFIPSKDGIPNYDSATNTFDFRCNTDSAYFMMNNKVIQVPQPLVVKNSVFANPVTTSAKLIYDADSGSFSFIGWTEKLGINQTMIGGLRRSNKGWFWSGSMDITVDGKEVNQYIIPSNILFSISSKVAPDFNTDTREFNFNSQNHTTATVFIGDRAIPVPEGTIATPTEEALTGNTLRLVFNVVDYSAKIINWTEEVPPYCVALTTILMNYYGHPLIMGGFPYTIDGADPDAEKNKVELTPSKDGAPIFNVSDRSLDLNCYTDSAYIVYNGNSYRVPRQTIIESNGDFKATSIKFAFNPASMEFKSLGWNEPVELGWTVIASARLTVGNEVLFSANFPITVKGASFKSRATDNPLNAKIKGINHRGFNTVAPEESRSAYLLSKQNGYHHWEGDINWTKDNVPMMIHDLAINRTARNLDGSQISGTVNLTDLNYADLAKYDFGIVKGDRYKGEPLLSFEELVKLARYNDTFLHIEFKYAFTDEQVQILHNIIKKYNMLDRIGWQAFGWDNLKPMMALEPNGQYELLGGDINDDYFNKMDALKTDNNTIIASQDASRSVVDIQKIADKGYPIYLWTVDDGDTVRKFRNIGMVEGIMTNGAINVADELTK